MQAPAKSVWWQAWTASSGTSLSPSWELSSAPCSSISFSAGLQWTARSRSGRRAQREAEEADWRSGDPTKRQKLFNVYLFSVLKYFIIGSILIGVATAASDLEPTRPNEISNLDYLNFVADGIGVCFYGATLATILRFTRLMRQYW
jgi:hypothetical protein